MGRGGREVAGGGGGGGTAAGYWVGRLVVESFFVGCGVHESRKKNEKNMFCLRCCASVCSHCASSHSSHPLLQVRRYVYHDVVRLDDLEKLIDCSHVQPYTINSAKVVFLKPRPQSRPFKGSGNICPTCERILQEPYHFCSLSCKVDHVVSQGKDLSSILLRLHNSPDFTFSHFDGDFKTDNSDFLDYDGAKVVLVPKDIRLKCESETPKRKKSEEEGRGRGGFFPQIELSLSNRRKGAPHRAPLS